MCERSREHYAQWFGIGFAREAEQAEAVLDER